MTTAIQLITDALYLSGVLGLESETANDTQESVGLRLLNGILSGASDDGSMIPYEDFRTFETENGVQKYFVEELVQLETLTFILPQNVRFQMVEDSTFKFFGASRVENVKSLPSHYYVQRKVGGAMIWLYFVPDKAYEMQMFGKFAQTLVSINDELDESYDLFYQKWLKYKLASELCQQYNMQFNPEAVKELEKLTNVLFQLVGIDLTMRKVPLVSRNNSTDYWWNVNFGHNFVPVGRGR